MEKLIEIQIAEEALAGNFEAQQTIIRLMGF